MKPAEIYVSGYTDSYRRLYVDHPQWALKHRHNLSVLEDLTSNARSWLDTCCGQAWHFEHLRNNRVSKTGVDISAAQLAAARVANPDVTLIEADLETFEFSDCRTFDVVTNFWGAYSYLDDEAAIARFMRKLIRWTSLGGSTYIELITPQALESYTMCSFAETSGTYTSGRSDDYVQWSFSDPGGTHLLTSPREAFFLDIFGPCFESIDSGTVITTMRQFIARGKLRDPKTPTET